MVENAPFKNGHMRRKHFCITCESLTRRTIAVDFGRYVLCSRCELPSAETRLLIAVFNVESLPELERLHPVEGKAT